MIVSSGMRAMRTPPRVRYASPRNDDREHAFQDNSVLES